MDKRVIFAVAGSGKTTAIVKSLSRDKRSLIITYTIANYENLCRKISEKFDGEWPEGIHVMKYFTFLYRFCYKPFLSDKVGAKGLYYKPNPNMRLRQSQAAYYITSTKYLYSNRLAFLLENEIDAGIDNIKKRLEKYFDELIIDEVQDIAGRDFNFLEKLMTANLNMFFVGDFYQHTYDTSRDGNVNKNLFDNKSIYESRFIAQGVTCDVVSLGNSWRCSPSICRFVTAKLRIEISSNCQDDGEDNVVYISDKRRITELMADSSIIKLHYQKAAQYGIGHKNWGETKGEDQYQDVCVMLNKTTAKKYAADKLHELPASTRNKLYVAITRAHGKVYLVNEEDAV